MFLLNLPHRLTWPTQYNITDKSSFTVLHDALIRLVFNGSLNRNFLDIFHEVQRQPLKSHQPLEVAASSLPWSCQWFIWRTTMPCAMQIFWCACGSPQPDLDGPCGSLAECSNLPRKKRSVLYQTASVETRKNRLLMQ